MFYIFPQNKKYTISKDLVVKLDDIIIETIDGKITIDIYGEEKEVSLVWMYGMALWGIEMPEEHKDEIYNIEFKPIDLNTHNMKEDYIAVFKNPVIVNKTYRLIAHLPSFAVDKDGGIWSLPLNRRVKTYKRSGYLILADLVRNKVYNVHRLTALAWIPNDDFISKPLVNHIDGDKSNCSVSNLEWCNFSQNIRHAIASGLTSQSEAYIVLDTHTNEEKLFHSVTDLSKYVGLNTIPYLSARIARHAQYVLLKRYLIKASSNDGPWLKDKLLSNNNNIIARNSSTAIEIEAKNISTGEIQSGKVSVLSQSLGININTLDGLRRKYKQHSGYGYIFRDPTYMEWDDIIVTDNIYKPKQIVAINVNTKEEHVFKSLRETARFISCDKKIISSRLNQNKEYKSYIFKIIN